MAKSRQQQPAAPQVPPTPPAAVAPLDAAAPAVPPAEPETGDPTPGANAQVPTVVQDDRKSEPPTGEATTPTVQAGVPQAIDAARQSAMDAQINPAVLVTEPSRTVPAPTIGRIVNAFGYDPDNTGADAEPFPAVIVRVIDAAAAPPVVGLFVMAAPAKLNGANNTGYYPDVKLYPAGEGPKTGPGSGRHAEWMPYQQKAAALAAK